VLRQGRGTRGEKGLSSVSGYASTQGQENQSDVATCISLVMYSAQEEQGESGFGMVEENEQAEEIFRVNSCVESVCMRCM